ncbi:MAG TPA: aldehyde dehydrogenase family protein [Candidatus Acidoferrales bacterium]|nr:aldehyde dehydrogenase family protein [Candidatus Acidoferrales bacterium]
MARDLLLSYVGDAWRSTNSRADDLNPAAPGEVVAVVALADQELAVEAIAAAHSAFPAWSRMSAPARGDILRRAADLLDDRVHEIAREFSREEGKTLAEAGGETRRAAAVLRYYAGQTLEPDGETYPSHNAETLLFARREPVGVVSVLTPWNFPIAIPAWKIAPALAYGNTVVWKPAELVPLTATHLTQALIDAGLPPGVLNMVLGRGSVVGEVLVSDPRVAAVTFTGSNEVGRAVQMRAIGSGKRVQLEMGGKNPAVVLADADLELGAEMVARGAFLSTGQKCTATSRVIVEQGALPELQERLVAIAREWRVGDPLHPDTRIGPLSSADQLQRVLAYFDSARADGGRFLAGGVASEGLAGGYFVPPTVIDGLGPGNRVAREEIFGPVVVLLPVASFEDAVSLANDTPFGLSASVFTRDLGRALRFAREIRAGVVKVNQESAGVEFQVPFGGAKDSSAGGREQGKAAREFFTEWKTVYIDSSLA